jgi:ribosomal protein L6P/L9E
MAAKVHTPDFMPRTVKIKVDDNDSNTVEGADDDEVAIEASKAELEKYAADEELRKKVKLLTFQESALLAP